MILEEYIKTPVQAQCDVLVCGGGFAGISAALAAARQGKKVILLEKQFVLGGLATAGLVTIYLPLCDGWDRQVSFGIALQPWQRLPAPLKSLSPSSVSQTVVLPDSNMGL